MPPSSFGFRMLNADAPVLRGALVSRRRPLRDAARFFLEKLFDESP